MTQTAADLHAAKHTPGPWRYNASDHLGEFVITGSNEGGGSILPILGRTHNFPHNAEANARLIAAAPDLLAALKRLVADYSDVPDPTDTDGQAVFAAARAAIAMATVQS